MALPVVDHQVPERVGSRRTQAIDGSRYPIVCVWCKKMVRVESFSVCREGWREALGKESQALRRSMLL